MVSYVNEEPNYNCNAPVIPVVPETKVRLPVFHKELILGIWNCGWSCEGAGLFIDGCASNFNEYY